MSPRTRLLLWLCVATSSLLAGCGASDPPPPKPAPPPPKAEAPAPKAEDPLKRLAGEAFVFGYPLVLMDVTREAQTAKAPVNTFHHRRALADASSTDLRANADVLFSTAWLDLSKEPLILSVPDTRGRYYVLPLIDAWTNVFSSPGKRQTGTAKIDFAIVGPRWKGTLPEGVSEIKAPTEMVWVVGRMEVGGKADIAAVAKLQDQFRLTPMSQWGKRGAKPAPAPSSSTAGVDSGAGAAEGVAAMDAQTFLSRLAMLLAGNPPTPPDPAIEAKLKQLGLVPGQAFEIGKLDAASQAAVQEGVKSAKDAIATAARGSLGDLRNGWTIHWDLGRYGTNYGLRAVMASLNLGANAPEDALFASTRFDGADGRSTAPTATCCDSPRTPKCLPTPSGRFRCTTTSTVSSATRSDATTSAIATSRRRMRTGRWRSTSSTTIPARKRSRTGCRRPKAISI